MPRSNLLRYDGAAGLDEAGRGPLAGPVVAAAVILPPKFDLKGVDDSKKLTALRREELAERIKDGAVWSVAIVGVEEVDRLNILWASLDAMCRAWEALPVNSARAFVDGNRISADLVSLCDAEAVVKADGKIACVAAASILAKTARDAIMRDLSHHYPGYGFDSHFGYSTPEHLEALRRLGPCPIHRQSFAPVQEAQQPCLIFAE